ANVRATQMAFQHNQKTLELGLRMADSLREGVQVLAEAQADWIKSAAGSRGFFRNMKSLALPEEMGVASVERNTDEQPPEAGPDGMLFGAPGVGVIFKQGVTAVMEWMEKRKTARNTSTTPGLQFRDLFDWNGAAKRGQLDQPSTSTEEPAAP